MKYNNDEKLIVENEKLIVDDLNYEINEKISIEIVIVKNFDENITVKNEINGEIIIDCFDCDANKKINIKNVRENLSKKIIVKNETLNVKNKKLIIENEELIFEKKNVC